MKGIATVISRGNAEMEKRDSVRHRNTAMDHRLQALCAARVRWPLTTAIQAARVPEPSPLNGPRSAILYRFEKTYLAQQAGAGYPPQGVGSPDP